MNMNVIINIVINLKDNLLFRNLLCYNLVNFKYFNFHYTLLKKRKNDQSKKYNKRR